VVVESQSQFQTEPQPYPNPGVSFIGFAVGVMVSDVLDNRVDAKNNKVRGM
jgi:hypothetical protein